MEEKSEGAKAAVAPHQSIATATTVAKPNFYLFFWTGNRDPKGNFGTKNGVDSECMKAILLSILKLSYHIYKVGFPKLYIFGIVPPKHKLLKKISSFGKNK